MLKRSGRAAKRARAPRAPSAQSLGGYMRHSTRLAGCLLAVVAASPGLVGMGGIGGGRERSEEHTSELQSQSNLVCRLLLEKKKKEKRTLTIHYSNQTKYM